MESISCELCGQNNSSTVFNTFDRNWRLPGEFTIVRCNSCGFIFLNPRPDIKEIAKYYPETFSARKRQFKAEEFSKERKIANRVMEIKMRPLIDMKKTGRILDIGCADGFLLDYMKKQGWEVFGVEPHEPSVKLAKENFGLDIFNGYLEDAHFDPDYFDAITMTHVLEHVHNAGPLLKTINKLLKHDGTAMIEVPNIDSLESKIFKERWMAIDAPRHLFHFTPLTLSRILENNDFRVVKIVHGSDLGKNKLGYVESLRFVLTDLGLRKPQQKPLTMGEWSNTESDVKKKNLLNAIHFMENNFFAGMGLFANVMKMGSRIVAFAGKK